MKITAAVWPVRHVWIFWGTSSIRVAFNYRDFSWKQSKHNVIGHGMNHAPPVFTTVKVKWSCYRPGVAQRVGRGIALLFHDRGTRRVWAVSSTPWPQFTPGKDPVPILHEAVWAPGPVWIGRKSHPHQDSILDHPACSQSLYRLSYPDLIYHCAYRNCIASSQHSDVIHTYTSMMVQLPLQSIIQWSLYVTFFWAHIISHPL